MRNPPEVTITDAVSAPNLKNIENLKWAKVDLLKHRAQEFSLLFKIKMFLKLKYFFTSCLQIVMLLNI
jgi:hypothetical protein